MWLGWSDGWLDNRTVSGLAGCLDGRLAGWTDGLLIWPAESSLKSAGAVRDGCVGYSF